jgi:MazG family protein
MPALIKALRLQEKTKQVGFEWDNTQQVRDKVDEEIRELYEAVEQGDQKAMEDEFGDVMFALINYARFIKVDPELALDLTNKKFIRRFQQMEVMADEAGKSLHDMTLEEMDALWNQAKTGETKR